MRYTAIEERPLPEKRAQDVLIDEIIEFEMLGARQNTQNGSDELPYGTMNTATLSNC